MSSRTKRYAAIERTDNWRFKAARAVEARLKAVFDSSKTATELGIVWLQRSDVRGLRNALRFAREFPASRGSALRIPVIAAKKLLRTVKKSPSGNPYTHQRRPT